MLRKNTAVAANERCVPGSDARTRDFSGSASGKDPNMANGLVATFATATRCTYFYDDCRTRLQQARGWVRMRLSTTAS